MTEDQSIELPDYTSYQLVPLLDKATEEERRTLSKILYPDELGSVGAQFSSTKLVAELCSAGGHSVSNAFRGKGVPYSEIVIDVYQKLKIEKPLPPESMHVDQRVEKSEKLIVEHLFAQIVESMTPEQKIEFEKELKKVANDHGVSYAGLSISGGALAIAGAAGFAPFLMATTTLGAITGALGITLPFAAYTTLTSTLGVIIGPVGWLGLAAYATYSFGQPNFKKTIPAVALIYAIRSRLATE